MNKFFFRPSVDDIVQILYTIYVVSRPEALRRWRR